MKKTSLKELSKHCDLLNYPAKRAMKEYEDRDFRSKHVALHPDHLPVLIYATLVAAGLRKTTQIPLSQNQHELINFLAPEEIKDQTSKTINDPYNKTLKDKILDFIKESKQPTMLVFEDFFMVKIQKQSSTLSHVAVVCLRREHGEISFEATLYKSQSDSSPLYQHFRDCLASIISDKAQQSRVRYTWEEEDNLPPPGYLYYDYAALKLAEHTLNKMYKPYIFEIPPIEEKVKNAPLREALYQAHETKGNIAVKIQPLVKYLCNHVLKNTKTQQAIPLPAEDTQDQKRVITKPELEALWKRYLAQRGSNEYTGIFGSLTGFSLLEKNTDFSQLIAKCPNFEFNSSDEKILKPILRGELSTFIDERFPGLIQLIEAKLSRLPAITNLVKSK
jgi:hypothetical protein